MKIRATRAVLALALLIASVDLGAVDAQTTTTQTYSYDVLGRVTTATTTAAPSLQTSYAYDPAGNRLQHYVGAAGGGAASTSTAAAPSGAAHDTPPTPPPSTNGITCATASSNIQAHSSGTISVGFSPPSECTDTTSGATMSVSSWSVSGAGTGTSPSPPTINLTLSVGNTVVTYTVVDNKGGSASATFTFNRTS